MKKLLCFILSISFCLICSCSTKEKNGPTPNESTQNSSEIQSTESENSSSIQLEISEDNNSHSPILDIQGEGTINLMSEIKSNEVLPSETLDKGNQAYNNFSVELFKKSLSKDGENTLISPLSVIYALGLTANGANGETLKQMEDVFGISVDELNQYLYSYLKQKATEDAAKLSIANSIWFADRFAPRADFLQKNADYYNAAAYKANFSDSKTVADINNWISEKTKGMIKEVIKEIDPDTVMFLINALAFEDEWLIQYDSEYSVRDGEFTTANGEKVTAQFMHGDNEKYIYDENAEGFIKYYKGKYAFAALLPKEGMSIEEYVSTLSGEKISTILNREETYNFELYTSLPKFETEYSIEMKDVFKELGMTDAFLAYTANFSKMGEADGLHIASILQKTFISVGELGTKAGAASVVIMNAESCPMERKTIHLNRPFVYMLIDTTTNTPFFVGAMMNPA